MKAIHHQRRAFTLIEILVVLGIMVILMGITVSSMKVQGSQEFSKNLSEMAGILELSQTHAISNRSTVRVLIGMDHENLVLLPLSFAPGGSPTDDESNQMENAKNWVPIAKPVIVKNIKLNESIAPLSDKMVLLTESASKPVARVIASKEINFEYLIQFLPSGEAALDNSESPIRGIQWGLETLGAKSQKAVVQISRLTGRVQILREEDLAR